MGSRWFGSRVTKPAGKVSLRFGQLGKRKAHLVELWRLAQHAIHMRRNIVIVEQTMTPTREGYDRCSRRAHLDGRRDRASVDVGHPEIGNHDGEWHAMFAR